MKKKWTSVILAVCLVVGYLFSNSSFVPVNAATETVSITPTTVSNVEAILPEPTIYYSVDPTTEGNTKMFSYTFKFTLKKTSMVRINGLSRYTFSDGGTTTYTLAKSDASVKEEWSTGVYADHLWTEKEGNYCDKVFTLSKGTYYLYVSTSLANDWATRTWMGQNLSDMDCGLWLAVNTSACSKPKAPTIKSVTNKAGKKIAVKYAKVANVDGYAIQYSTNKKFTKKTTKTATKLSKTLTKLQKKKYYVRVRAYRLLTGGAKYYGAWSSVKSVTVKK